MNLYQFFITLTGNKPVTRRFGSSYDTCCVKMISNAPTPHYRAIAFTSFFTAEMKRMNSIKMSLLDIPINHTLIRYEKDNPNHKLLYSNKRWSRVYPNPFLNDNSMNRSKSLIRILDRKLGLADITHETSRIKSISLQYALNHSTLYDIRF